MAEVETQGSLGFEFLQYTPDDEDTNNDYQGANLFKIKSRYEKDEFLLNFQGYARLAYFDETRNFANLDETYLAYTSDNYKITIGNQIYNWSIMEVFGLGDNYNARNLANSSLETERIGLPSLNILYEFDESFIQFVLIYETLPSHFPQKKNRSGLQLELESPHFLTGDNETGERDLTEFIFRFKKYFENFELDFHFTQKYDTAYPIITIDKPNAISPSVDDLEIRPYYQPIRQTYLSLQSEFWDALWKFEFINVDFQGYSTEFFFPPSTLNDVEQLDFKKASFGLEKAHDYQNNHSATFLVEYTSVFEVTYEEARSFGAFQRDVMFGYRHSFNDFKAHEIQIATIIDVQSYDEFVYSLKHTMRLNNYWTLESQATLIDTPKPSDDEFAENYYGLKPLRESDNININIIRYF